MKPIPAVSLSTRKRWQLIKILKRKDLRPVLTSLKAICEKQQSLNESIVSLINSLTIDGIIPEGRSPRALRKKS